MTLASVATALCAALGAPASAACVVLAGTGDGFDKETAASRAQLALEDYIKAVQGREPSRRGHRQGHALIALEALRTFRLGFLVLRVPV